MRRMASGLGVVALVASSACSAKAPPAVEVTLSNAVFGTTGGNLFNCGSPAYPATSQAVSSNLIACDPGRAPDGTLSATPVTVTSIVGCGDGQGALVTVTCAGTGVGNLATGTVSIAITPSCSSTDSAGDPQSFSFQDLAPGATQSSPSSLDSCVVFSNLCGTSDPCAFNSFAADISVTNETR